MNSTKVDQDQEVVTPNIKRVRICNVMDSFCLYLHKGWLHLEDLCKLTGNCMTATS